MAAAAESQDMTIEWYVARNGESRGPFSTQEFHKAIDAGEVLPTDHVWRSDGADWVSAAPYVAAGKPTRVPALAMAGVIAALVVATVAVFATLPSKLEGLVQEVEQNAAVQPGTEVGADAIRARLLKDEPATAFFRALAEKDPAAFDGLVTHMAGQPLGTPEETIWTARSYMMSNIVKPKFKNMSDADMTELMQITRDMSRQLAETSPKVCLDVALERPFGDLSSLIDADVQGRERALMIKLLDLPEREVALPTAERVQQINMAVAQQLVRKYPDKVHLLDLASVQTQDEKAACLIFVEYLDTILALPDEERAAMLRAMNVNPALLETQASEQAPAAPQVPAAEGALGAEAQPSPSTEAPSAAAPESSEEPSFEFPATTAEEPEAAPAP